MLESWPSVSCWQWTAPLWQSTESFPTPAVSLGNCSGEEREERGREGRRGKRGEERGGEGREGRRGKRGKERKERKEREEREGKVGEKVNMIDGARGMG